MNEFGKRKLYPEQLKKETVSLGFKARLLYCESSQVGDKGEKNLRRR